MAARTSGSPGDAVSWAVRYRVESQVFDGWFDCEVVELSRDGAVLDLGGGCPEVGAGLRVEFRWIRSGTTLRLPAIARNVRASTGATQSRLGVEWATTSWVERAVLEELVGNDLEVDAGVVVHEREMAERGAHQKGEGRVP